MSRYLPTFVKETEGPLFLLYYPHSDLVTIPLRYMTLHIKKKNNECTELQLTCLTMIARIHTVKCT